MILLPVIICPILTFLSTQTIPPFHALTSIILPALLLAEKYNTCKCYVHPSLPWSVFPSDALDCTAINTWQDTLANEISYSDISFLGSDSSGLGYFCRTIYLILMLSDSTKTYFTADGHEINIPQNYMDALDSLNFLDNKFLLTLNGADGKTYFTLLDLADGSTFDPVLIPDSPQVVAQNGSVLAICSLSKSFRIYSVENGTELDTFDISDTDTTAFGTFSLVVTILLFTATTTRQ